MEGASLKRLALVSESTTRICWTIWISILILNISVTNPHKGASGLRREIFFLNLEDGYFGCQVNESVDVLKVFELSKLCDGSPQCFLGSDELHEELKCTDDCTEKTGRECINGACLSSQCYCNDGFGGKGCEMPDENECKYRPCDIFAHCTNTMGSYYCSCFPGYEEIAALPGKSGGNLTSNFQCKDIDECKISSFSHTCAQNSECWNLPGHYACRCLPGFEPKGGTVAQPEQCLDVQECLSSPCGELETCQEKVGGGYTCNCLPGYLKTQDGCKDVNECTENPNSCIGNSECKNTPGSYKCICPQGFALSNNVSIGSPGSICQQVEVNTHCKSNFDCANNAECSQGVCACRAGFHAQGISCHDINECDNDPCGINAICNNVPGGFRCKCEANFPVGDPFSNCKASCQDIDCGPHAFCSTTEKNSEIGDTYCVCEEGYSFDPKNISAGCVDINECTLNDGKQSPCGRHSICNNIEGSFSCSCEKGFEASGISKYNCNDVNECTGGLHTCGENAVCINLLGTYECSCPKDTIPDPDPRTKCLKVKICLKDSECPGNGVCDPIKKICTCPEPNVGEDCRHPCEGVKCGPRAECILINDSPVCACPNGFHGSPTSPEGCIDIDECIFQPCGEGICRNKPGKYSCECPLGFEPVRVQNSSGYPESCRSVSPRSCRRESDCPIGEECVDHTTEQRVCVCPRGFTRDFKSGKCVDVNECLELESPCGFNALCKNMPGSYDCECPLSHPVGNPFQACEECNEKHCPCPPPFKFVNMTCVMDSCSPTSGCSNGGQCITTAGGMNYCTCPKGYTSVGTNCVDTNECLKAGICGPGSECVNKPGSYECVCLNGYIGDPYKEGCSHPLLKCHTTKDCVLNEKCVGPGVCICAPPFQKDGSECKLLCDTSDEGAYKVCTAQKRTCAPGSCGKNAECVDGGCVCKLGYEGDPFKQCEDVNECNEDICGRKAHCINLQGSYDCRCDLNHPSGNPFVECFKASENLLDCGKYRCTCGVGKSCPDGFSCISGICKDNCNGVNCGANSVCVSGKCECINGFTVGENSSRGCESRTCENDLSCSPQEICYAIPGGNRICIDGCNKIQCGPNSVCLTENHRSTCVCKDLFTGNGVDCQPVKVSERVDDCASTNECFDGFLCSHSTTGGKKCVDPCQSTHCGGPNQACVRDNGRAICKCKPGFILSKETGVCEPPLLSDCARDEDCPVNYGCLEDSFGLSHCINLCDGISCGPNAICHPNPRRENEPRRASCHCKPSFTGNPEDRLGCVALAQNECEDDVDCSENHICVEGKGGRICKLACEMVKCGPNAICTSNNHVAQCQCTPGKYKGNPSDPSTGCIPVPCIFNSDCHQNQTCNRLQNRCHDICTKDTCGKNSVCIPEKHTYRCVCATGYYSSNPENGCFPSTDCSNNPCHPTAMCSVENNELKCHCKNGEVLDSDKGCIPQLRDRNCASHEDCPSDAICRDRKCVNPCRDTCAGENSICRVVDRVANCSCEIGFEATIRNNETICTRQSSKCSNDGECREGICVDNQCKVICQLKSDCASEELCVFGMCMLPCVGHTQCPTGQTCAGGYCVVGCRNNKDCPLEETCLNHQCINPCSYEGVCGPNSLCRPISHSPQCYCPENFISSPFDGCYRNITQCSATNDCPSSHICLGGSCFLSCESTSTCARGEQCQNNICVKVCYTDSNCLLGEICVEGVCAVGCRSDVDCGVSETCLSNKCRCANGFTSGPTGCRDLNECDTKGACHSSALCLNSPGSYRCECPLGLFSENPSKVPCGPQPECVEDSDCGDKMNCLQDNAFGVKKCVNPCQSVKCGPRAECDVVDHKTECKCMQNHLGNGDVGCYAVECTEDEHCPSDENCESSTRKCVSPCGGNQCGNNGICSAKGHQAICSCNVGFESRNSTCQDIDECLNNPCHATSICVNIPGGYNCKCPEGKVGNKNGLPGCTVPDDCHSIEDCPSTATCKNGKCKEVCEGVCGIGAICEIIDRKPVCACEKNIGDPYVKCGEAKCTEELDCPVLETCYNHECKSPCDIPHICGSNSNCTVISHKALCFCGPGFTGDPVIGCVKIMNCDAQNQCPASSVCENGVCKQTCTSHRDCLPIQSCLNKFCQSPCTFDSDCSPFQICETGFCKDHSRCSKHSECNSDEVCRLNYVNGIAECQPVCDKKFVRCPQILANSHCVAKNHDATCACDKGFILDSQQQCVPIQCMEDSDCDAEKTCVNSQCEVVCKVVGDCPENSICVSEGHKPHCKCQPGFVKNIFKDGKGFTCKAIDFCSSNPCGLFAFCENTGSDFICHCSNDYVRTSLLAHKNRTCEPAKKCKSNADCPVSANCSSVGSISGVCSYFCVPGICGPNSKCNYKNHAFVDCECNPGYTRINPRDPFSGCREDYSKCTPYTIQMFGFDCFKKNSYCNGTECFGPCDTDAECGPTEACLGNQCTNLCDASQACGLNAICKIVNHKKTCQCSPNFTGNANLECVRVAIPCQSITDCPSRDSCQNGICIPECQSDHSCAGNERCINGKCMLTCQLDEDCFLNHICINKMCSIGCHSNSDCSAEESCQQKKCVNLCKLGACGPNAICQSVDHQPRCSCSKGMLPNPTPHLGCIREPISCSENRDCKDIHMCVNGFCKQACGSSGNCYANEDCDGEFCVQSCRKDSDCSKGDICKGTVCVPGCRSDNLCRENHACINNKCMDPCKSSCDINGGNCTSSGPCGPNSICNVSAHKAVCNCVQPYVNNGVGCTVPEIGCESKSECPNEMNCVDKKCRIQCLSDEKCQSNERCVDGICVGLCSGDDQCSTGTICQGRICQPGCRIDSNCPSHLSCINRQCKDPCHENAPCGNCSTCESVGHRAICSCPFEWGGDPQRRCYKPYFPCADGKCSSGETCIDGSCLTSCKSNKDCSCSQSCFLGTCRNVCDGDEDCNDKCEGGFCNPRCRTNSECSQEEACINGKCASPCLSTSCSKASKSCIVSQHRAICICPNGSPEVNNECNEGECSKDSDCKNQLHACITGTCKNPCLESGTCGDNAFCRMLNGKPLCSCPVGWTGSPTDKCVQVGKDDCRGKGCGINSACLYTDAGYRCTCSTGCVPRIPGSPEGGCECRKLNNGTTETCNLKCGINAECKRLDNTQKTCMCLKEFPNGDPMISCTALFDRNDDCRVLNCGKGSVCSKVNGVYDCVKETPCTLDSDCEFEEACIRKICRSPCENNPCQEKEWCHVVDHKVACSSNGPEDIECELDPHSQICASHDDSTNSLPNFTTEAAIECGRHMDCPLDKACNQNTSICEDPCIQSIKCTMNQECRTQKHVPVCICKQFVVNEKMELHCPETEPEKCTTNDECLSSLACIFGTCQNPCNHRKCPDGTVCKALHHSPYCLCDRAECNTTVEICIKDSGCPGNLSCTNYRCVDPCESFLCPVGFICLAKDHKPLCKYCKPLNESSEELMCEVLEDEVGCSYSSECHQDFMCLNGVCGDPCRLENPCAEYEVCSVVNHTISCRIGPPETLIQCNNDSQCPTKLFCTENGTCESPCIKKKCGPTSYCITENHVAKCMCLEGGLEHEGNCIRRFRTDFPRPEMTVNCLGDGIQVDILTGPFGNDFRGNGSEFNGLLYVKGHSKDPQCRKSVQPYLETVDFEVKFGSCGLIHNDGEASFVLVIQKHPRLVTYNAQAYDIKCVYMTGEKTITLGFNVSMLTTAGTIANTGPPPTCSMRIATANGGEISSAEIGESLVLRIDVQPSSIYGGFARRCVAKTMEGDGENEYPVTDEDGCASDPSVFGDWEFEPETQILMAHFNAFKFPSSSSIKFQCNVRVCFGTCQPVNCRGENAYGRRRRSAIGIGDEHHLAPIGYEGQLREEVQIESNPILAIERREDRFLNPTESPQTMKEEVCISTTGFILSLIITSVLSLVAVAIAVSCWILAYKRRKRDVGPFPHPPDFPNPLFTATGLVTEPSPDYLS